MVARITIETNINKIKEYQKKPREIFYKKEKLRKKENYIEFDSSDEEQL